MELNDNLAAIIDKIRINAEDILGIIDFGIKPLLNKTKEEDYEISAETLDKLISELMLTKENLNKNFISLRRKIWGDYGI